MGWPFLLWAIRFSTVTWESVPACSSHNPYVWFNPAYFRKLIQCCLTTEHEYHIQIPARTSNYWRNLLWMKTRIKLIRSFSPSMKGKQEILPITRYNWFTQSTARSPALNTVTFQVFISNIVTHTEHPQRQAGFQNCTITVYTIWELSMNRVTLLHHKNSHHSHSANRVPRVHLQLQKQLRPPHHSCQNQLLHLCLPSFIFHLIIQLWIL